MAIHNEFGRKAEEMAAKLLIEKGCKILSKNYRFDKAEVDLIALDDNVLVAVEVKARSSIFYGDPQSFVNKKKIKLLVKAMNQYVIENGFHNEVRFDIVAVFKNKEVYDMLHIPNAFYHF